MNNTSAKMVRALPIFAVTISFKPEMYSGRLVRLVPIMISPKRNAPPALIEEIAAIHPGGGHSDLPPSATT